MGDEGTYKEFDTASIITRDTISIGKYKMRKRDLLLGGIAVIAIIIVIILAIVLASEVRNKSPGCESSTSSAQTSAQVGSNHSTPTCNQSVPVCNQSVPACNQSGQSNVSQSCTSTICLKTAAYQKSIMDESVKPCVDFYRFACGGYAAAYPRDGLHPEYTPFTQILVENVMKLVYHTDTPINITERPYELMVRKFMTACSNHFDKMEVLGKPIVEQIIKPLGGWYVLGNWDDSKFTLHEMLSKLQIEFWTRVFFTYRISPNANDWRTKIIQLSPSGYHTGACYYHNHTERPECTLAEQGVNEEIKAAYFEYMKTLAGYISRDAAVTNNASRIDQFADDVYEVEGKLADAILKSPTQSRPHDVINMISLGNITDLTNNAVNFVEFFNSLFPELNSMFTRNTLVAVERFGFFHNFGPILNDLTSTSEGKRKLHNYMMWQVIRKYSAYLSWDYVHAGRKVAHFMGATKDTTSGFPSCFNLAQNTMHEALGAMYLKYYLNQEDKKAGEKMLDLIKQQMIAGLYTAPWMSSDDRQEAAKKIETSLYKIGYPDFMVDDEYIDKMFSSVTITDDDFFGTVLKLNKITKKRQSDALAHPDSREFWSYQIMDPKVEYYNPWHELIATAGVLQSPLFVHNGPVYYNFGGIGSILASNLVGAINEIGAIHKLDMSNLGKWWTNFTETHYSELKQCGADAEDKAKLGPYKNADGNLEDIDPSIRTDHVTELLAQASGLKLSLKAYKAMISTVGGEKIPAGFEGYTGEKMLFLSFAQAYCQNTPDFVKLNRVLVGRIYPGEYSVNLAVSQLPEFREAYGCTAGDPMAPEKMCSLF